VGSRIHLEPVRDLLSLRDTLDKVFEETFARSVGRFTGGGRTTDCAWVPIDMYDTGGEIVVEAALPGVRQDCLDISVQGNSMTIHCAKPHGPEEPKGRTYTYREIGDGCLYRQVDLPVTVDVDKAYASYDHGVVRIIFPKSEAAKPKSIKVGPAIAEQARQSGQEGGHRTGLS